jgi:Tc5 transposase DNA-binding domain
MPWEELHPFKSFSGPKRELIIREGVDLYHNQAKPNLSAVKQFLDTKYKTNVCLGTIRNRASGAHRNARKGHEAQQLLSPIQENILIEWITLLSDTGHCISKRTLRKKAEVLCGRKPGQTWIRSFLSRHTEIVLGKPSGLDPKRAQAFNKPTVKRHFELLEAIIEKYGIPPENIYNMDEKGVQRGGGRKVQAQKFLVPREKRPKYKLRSGNLELITIVDCVLANGGYLSPAIIFEGKQQYEWAWFEVDPKIS